MSVQFTRLFFITVFDHAQLCRTVVVDNVVKNYTLHDKNTLFFYILQLVSYINLTLKNHVFITRTFVLRLVIFYVIYFANPRPNVYTFYA